jgi:F1F0 ATPase subunit 2
MTMSDILSPLLALAAVAGVLLGAVFFGGLWWTVRRGLASPYHGLWFIGSMLLRTGIVATGFYSLLALPADSWKILLAALLGFLLARGAATRFLPAPFSSPLGSGLDGKGEP